MSTQQNSQNQASRQARNGLLREAIRYARKGVPVFPLQPKTSTPIYPDIKGTCDEICIRGWWTEHPRANVGARTGPESGIWALEVTDDVGAHTLTAREEVYGPLPISWKYEASGPVCVFKSSNGDKIPSTVDEYAPGITTHGAGDFVVLPPSILSNGKALSWTHGPEDCKLARCEAPDIVTWIRERGGRMKTEDSATDEGPKEEVKVDTPSAKKAKKDLGDFICSYVYHDESGEPLHRTTRYHRKELDKDTGQEKIVKTFRQGVYEGNGTWSPGLGKCRLVLYRLPSVLKSDVVWLVEGEKDVENLEKLGLTATTTPMGAQKWPALVKKHRIHEPLRGKNVYVMHDADQPGLEHGHQICSGLTGHANAVKLITLPLADAKSDVSDLISRCGADEAKRILSRLVELTPDYVPTEDHRETKASDGDASGYQGNGDIKEKVKGATDLVALIRETVELKSDGPEFAGLCPLHGDTEPSLRVNLSKQSWYCHGCKKGGDCFTWVMERDKVGFREALTKLAARAGIEIDGRKKSSTGGSKATGTEGQGTTSTGASTDLDPERAKVKAAIESRLERLEQGDKALLDDPLFIAAVNWASQHWPLMYQTTLDSGRVSRMTNAIKQACRIYRAEMAARRKAKNEKETLPTIGSLLESAKLKPPSDEAGLLLMPRDYKISDKGEITRLVWKDAEPVETPICAFPVIPTKCFQTISTCEMFIELAWYTRKQWHHVVAPMSQALNVRGLVDLSGRGFPVGSDTVKEIQTYIRAVVQTPENAEKLKPEALSDHSGWIRTTPPIFLYGRTPIAATEASKVKLQVQSGGEEDILDAFENPQGDLESWLSMIGEIRDFPVAKIDLYAGFASVLLEPLGLSPFTLDISGTSTKGKTTATALSASAWGNPRLGAGLFDGWDSTKVNLERTLSLLNGLPVYKDDSSNANPRDIQGHLYGIAAGSGRGRGNKAGLARRTKYRGLVITNGEAPLTDSAAKEGAAVRVLSIRDAPFGSDKAKSLRAVQAVERSVHQNYGHAGPAFVKWLVDHWAPEDWRRRFDEIRAQYKGESEFAVRLSGYAAVISLASELLHKAVDMPWKYEDPWLASGLWEQVDFQLKDVPMGFRCLQKIVYFNGSNPHAFFDPDSLEDQRPPFGGWAGRASSLENWLYLDILPSWLEDFCKKHEFNQRAVTGYWKQRGWIATTETTINAKLGGKKTSRVYRLTRAACDEVLGVKPKAENRDKRPEGPAMGLIPNPSSCSIHVPRLGFDIPVPGWDGETSSLPDALDSLMTLLSQSVFDLESYIEKAKKDDIQ